jgi:FkbM family methyltransferase
MIYSQYGEDEIVLKLLGSRAPGTLLDVGAWHPRTFSNSRALIEAGWKAVLIEPSPGPLRELVAEYGENPNVKVIGAALTVEDEHVFPLRISDDGLSSADSETLKKWATTGGYFGTMWTPALSLARFFNQFGGEFEFVSIDTEGTSIDLAKAYLAGPEPLVMIVEHDNRIVELMQTAQQHGYSIAHANGTNVILSRV